MPLRVTFWTELYAPHIGGIETVVSLLAEELVRRGHEAIVLTNRTKEAPAASDDIRGVQVHRFALSDAMAQRDLRQLRRACASIQELKHSFQPDVEHVHSIGSMHLARLLNGAGAQTPTITSIHFVHNGIPNLIASGGVFVDLMRCSRAVLAPSELIRRTLVRSMPEVESRVHFLPYGLAVPPVAVSPLPFDPPVILCLGRLVREKGFDLALDAFSHVRASAPCARAIVAGDGPERERLRCMANDLGLGDMVEFTGWVPPSEVPSLINRATAVLVPSRWQEPAALVTIESAIMGRPVIATAVGGLVELVENGDTGLIVENENPEAIAQALQRLLTNPEETRRIGEFARHRSRRRHAFDRYFDLHLDFYTQAATAR